MNVGHFVRISEDGEEWFEFESAMFGSMKARGFPNGKVISIAALLTSEQEQACSLLKSKGEAGLFVEIDGSQTNIAVAMRKIKVGPQLTWGIPLRFDFDNVDHLFATS